VTGRFRGHATMWMWTRKGWEWWDRTRKENPSCHCGACRCDAAAAAVACGAAGGVVACVALLPSKPAEVGVREGRITLLGV